MARRRHSVRHRKRKHNRTRSKRGGENTTDDYEKMEKGLLTNEKGRVTNIQFFDPTKINNNSVEYKLPGPTTKEEVDEFFSNPSDQTIQQEKRANADKELVTLLQKYKNDTERKKGVKAYEESLKNPMTAADLFANPPPYKTSDEECVKKGCIMMGGRKSRRNRRKTKRTRKSRRHRSKH
jgi:phage protein D